MSDTPRMDAYPMEVVERAIREALHPQGMSTHDGKVKLDCSHVMSIIARGRAAERELTDLREKLAESEKDAERLHFCIARSMIDWRVLNLPMRSLGWQGTTTDQDEYMLRAIDAAIEKEKL